MRFLRPGFPGDRPGTESHAFLGEFSASQNLPLRLPRETFLTIGHRSQVRKRSRPENGDERVRRALKVGPANEGDACQQRL